MRCSMGRIDIRNIPDEYLPIIDQLAQSQSLSREAYLRLIIEKLVREELLYMQSEKFAQVVEKATEIVARNNQLIEQLLDRGTLNE
jgi:hypothetical protein